MTDSCGSSRDTIFLTPGMWTAALIDEVLLAQIKEIITPLGWTVERLIVRFLEWLVDPETQEEAIAWLMKAKEELGEK